jgi:putative ubiquitin-RnfH superfamily antitoxin RatB of RatAB toxin-antitoxin module
MSDLIRVEVAYASVSEQTIVVVMLKVGSTIEMAILQSGILDLFPEIDLACQKVGVFSKVRELSDVVNEGDRVEIYRPLVIDPKEARRAKAKKAGRRGDNKN